MRTLLVELPSDGALKCRAGGAFSSSSADAEDRGVASQTVAIASAKVKARRAWKWNRLMGCLRKVKECDSAFGEAVVLAVEQRFRGFGGHGAADLDPGERSPIQGLRGASGRRSIRRRRGGTRDFGSDQDLRFHDRRRLARHPGDDCLWGEFSI